MFTETDEFGCPVVGSRVGALPHDCESLPFATQLDWIDNALTLSAAAADSLEGVFPVTSELPKATSTQPDSIDLRASFC